MTLSALDYSKATTILVGYDTETELIGPGKIIPPTICGSYDFGEHVVVAENGEQFRGQDVLSISDGLLGWVYRLLREMKRRHQAYLKDPAVVLIILSIHNASFDVCGTANAQTESGEFENEEDQPWDLWFYCLVHGLIHCTMVRERLINLSSHGQLDEIYEPAYKVLRYDLATLVQDYFGEDISEGKKVGKDGVEPWRLRYFELKGLSAKKYPKEAYDYALSDAIHARRLDKGQDERVIAGRESGEYPSITLTTQEIQTAADTCLLLMTAWGACIDTTKKAEIVEMLERELAPDKIKLLLESGILSKPIPSMPQFRKSTKKGVITQTPVLDPITGKQKMTLPVKSKKSMKALKREVKRVCEANGIPLKLTPKGQQLEKEGKLLSDDAPGPSGYTAQKEVNGQIIEREWPCIHFDDENEDDDEDTACVVCKKEAKAQGFKLLKVYRYSDVICTDKDMIGQIAHLDPVLDQYEDWQGLQKLVTTELPRISGTVVHSPFKILVKTTRTSSFELKEGAAKGKRALYPSWNGQNVDPRVRPVAVPRPGYVFFSVDYKASNLVSLAYTCLKLFGESVLADTLNAEIDPHARLASALAFFFIEEFRIACEAKGVTNGQSIECFYLFDKQKKATKENHDKTFWVAGFPNPPGFDKDPKAEWKGGSFFKWARTYAKPVGLGLPGGLGVDKFVMFARATYKVIITREEAAQMKEIWKVTFPEMPEYLKYINNNLKDPTSSYDQTLYAYQSPLGMHRARADYCAAANGFGLQTPEAEGVKLATIALQKEIFTNKRSILYGKARCISLIHDEFFGEVFEDDLTTERVDMIRSIIQKPMADLLPGVKVGTSCAIMRRWWKEAEEVRDPATKKLICWEPQHGK